MLKTYLTAFLLLLVALPATAQYTLDEGGINIAPGFDWVRVYDTEVQYNCIGPSAAASGFYSHYFCGKRYGIQLQGGVRYARAATTNGADGFVITYSMLDVQAAALFKIRPVDYHRRKEWAVHVGPVFDVPIRYRRSALTLNENVRELASLRPVVPSLQVSVQFRRPAGETSWFIEPGIQYGLIPHVKWPLSDVSRANAFISFGYSIGDKRG